MSDIDVDGIIADIKKSPYPWRDLAIEELDRNGHWAEFAGFTRWLNAQDDLLDSAFCELDVNTKAALFNAFVAACDFAAQVRS